MTPEFAVVVTLATYAVLGVLLVSLNFLSFWRWWIKAAAIALTLAAFALSYWSISALLGWPSHDAMPDRFNLVASRIVEPDTARGTPGGIYLWVEEIDDSQIIISRPRAFEVPFDVQLAFEVEKAQQVLEEGGSIMGELDKSEAELSDDDGEARDQSPIDAAAGGNDGDVATGDGARFDGTKAINTLVFSDMPPVPLPTKPDIE